MTRTILIAEDSPTQQESIRRIVEEMGFLTICAINGTEAIALAKLHKPDLILMDVIMPQNNGFQATRALKRDTETQDIPIILVTTKSEETDKAWGMRQGAKAYLVKPFAETELRSLINEFLPAP